MSQIWAEGLGDFAAREQDLLAALKHDGARFLENLLNDPDLPVKDNQPRAHEQDYFDFVMLMTLFFPPFGTPRMGLHRPLS